MNLLSLNNQISILPSSDQPFLSSDIIFIKTGDSTVIFDTGRCDEAFEAIENIEGTRLFVLSHFHKDHMTNLSRISLHENDRVYCGSLTAKKASEFLPPEKIITVTDITVIAEGITIYPIPSSHEKGCLALVAGDIAFLGDATYFTTRDEVPVYNTSLLHQTIEVLKKLPVTSFYLSHTTNGPQPKDPYIKVLERIYAKRGPGEAYIDVSKFNQF